MQPQKDGTCTCVVTVEMGGWDEGREGRMWAKQFW